MKDRPQKPSGRESMPPDAAHRKDGAVGESGTTGQSTSAIGRAEFLREAEAHQDKTPVRSGSNPRPVVTQLPEGYTVVEQRVGHAVAQWLLQVRCECGYGWFERKEIEATRCPGCGRLVHLEFESRNG